MGVHVEWFDAQYLTTGILAAGRAWDGEVPGEHEDDDTVNAGNIAVTFGTDSVAVIEGTPERIREILTAALDRLNAATVPDLPSLSAPADEDDDEDEHEATCPYVYTEADAEAVRQSNARYVAKMREMHGDAANIYEATVPVPGTTCGASLNLWDKEPVRRSLWTQGGRWLAGPSSFADGGGGDEEVMCGNLHEWAVPEIDEWQ